MSLNCTTVRKLLRESLVGGRPWLLDREQGCALARQLQEQLRGQEHIFVTLLNEREKNRVDLCRVTILDPVSSEYYHWRHTSFELFLDEQQRLHLNCQREPVLVSEYGEIVSFVTACRERLLRQKAQHSKREKVKNLKTQAVVARVKQLAREEAFDFCIETKERALKLYLKLTERDSLELQVPYKDFEEVIPHLRGAIQSLRALYARRLRFSVRQVSGYSMDWVHHQSL